MAYVTIFTSTNAPVANQQFALNATGANWVWQDSNVFNNLEAGHYYFAVRRKNDFAIVAQGETIVLPMSDTPYTLTTTAQVVEITKAMHGRDLVRNVMVIDGDGNVLLDTPNIDQDQKVTFDFGQDKTVKIILM